MGRTTGEANRTIEYYGNGNIIVIVVAVIMTQFIFACITTEISPFYLSFV